VTVNVPDELAAQARQKGLAVEAYVEAVLAREAKARLRKGNQLDGSNIKNLIHEGHTY
jgi:post-segregation antitoxin (ccd killing protein)